MDKIEIKVTKKDRKILTQQSKKNVKEKVRNRAKVILLRADGCTERQIINKTDLSLNTILTYIKDYNKYGLKSIYTNNCKGRKSRLENDKEKILKNFERNPPKSIAEGCTRISDEFGIQITETPLRTFLKKTGYLTKKQKESQQKQK